MEPTLKAASSIKAPGGRIRKGFTLVEAAISSLVLGLVFVSAMRCTGHALTGRMDNVLQVRGALFAQQLMSEILMQAYADADGSATLGVDEYEFAFLRFTFDDVDDYNGHSLSPPRTLEGGVPPNSQGWRQSAVVQWVNPNNPSQTSATDTGVKRITVTLTCDGVIVARLFSLRCDY